MIKAPNGILIAYYTHSGNTEEIANQIRELVGGDIFRIEPVKKYSRIYQEVLKESKVEIENDIKPPIVENVQEMGQYDMVFVGSPNWYSTIAPPVATFLSEHSLSGKMVIPFITRFKILTMTGGAFYNSCSLRYIIEDCRCMRVMTISTVITAMRRMG